MRARTPRRLGTALQQLAGRSEIEATGTCLYFLCRAAFFHASLTMTTDSWLTYEKVDIILLHLIQTNLQEHLNRSDATEGHGLHLAMVRLLDQFTEQTATPLMNLKVKQVFLWGNCVQNSTVLFRNATPWKHAKCDKQKKTQQNNMEIRATK